MTLPLPDKHFPLIEVLDDIEEYLEQRQDVRDGEDGPRPNGAMALLTRLAEARTLWARRDAPTEQEIDRALLASIPGGSRAEDWFMPHESEKAKANIRDVAARMLAAGAPRSSTREPYLHPILAAHRGTPAYEEEKAALAVADRPRGTYVPFTVHEIDLIRACLDDGTYTAQERQDIGKLCDMAINCLLYGDEISRLRDTPVSATRDSEIAAARKLVAWFRGHYGTECTYPGRGLVEELGLARSDDGAKT